MRLSSSGTYLSSEATIVAELATAHPPNERFLLFFERCWREPFDLDAELKIWVSGGPMLGRKRLNKNPNVYKIQGVIAGYVLG